MPHFNGKIVMNLIRLILAKGLNRTSVEIVLDLIYATTDILFPAEKITFGIPIETDPRPKVADDANTFIPASVDPSFDSRFTGPKKSSFRYKDSAIDGFMYRRVPLSLLTPKDNVLLIDPGVYPFRVHDFLDDINAKLNSKLSPNDVLNDVYTEPGVSIKLRAAPHSLVWIDGVEVFFDTVDGRILEDGSVRSTEDGAVRDVEFVPMPT